MDLNAIVSRTFDRRPQPGRPAVTLSLASQAPFVMARAEALVSALEVLRERAEERTPASGVIAVRTRVRAGATGRIAELEVDDSGPPLSPKQLAQVFDPYPDPEAPQDAAWVRLAAVSAIVRAHGGTVTAHRAGDAGTSIRIALPLHGPRSERMVPPLPGISR